ncbi:dTDP-4-dehydrorhamnose reductase [Humitalea rosea]|uniref:dTDP-4-dehydrorhamnose reductase n=1 Tax=Humitalea rosea TaxID=990373 RepID=A0A2W7IP83_9PROT|nr:SDR family NAD(P)-dependent oxidoreductase [Humitalea rosea]PZW49052.1 dTDP-4-dehydrorhamnose reductase [Humitalea rosea]
MPNRLLIFGLGTTGRAMAGAALAAGWAVTATARDPARRAMQGVAVIPFAEAGPAIAEATHLLVTAPPAESDPVIAAHHAALRAALRAAAPLRWVGYMSTTGVYGDRGGAWVDESTEPAPGQPRSQRRLAAEDAWRAIAAGRALELFRTAGIYGGAGPSVFDDLRAGQARRILAPGHAFGRIHAEDIGRATFAAAAQERAAGARVLHLTDDLPAPQADVVAEAARLLGLPPPIARPLAEVWPEMSPMARSFWSESRRVRNDLTKQALGIAWRYPTYREGLAAVLSSAPSS